MKIWKVALAAVVVVALVGTAGRFVMAQSDEATPTDEAAPTDEATPSDETTPSDEANPADEDRPDFLARLAENLGITEEELNTAIQDTQLELLDEAVAEGRIDEERAAEIRERIESGEGFKFGFGHHGLKHRIHHGVDEVAEFLGIEESAVREGLENGQTLGEIATANGSSPEALVDHLVAQLQERLATAVENERITQERADEILANARERIEEKVNSEPGEFRRPKDGLPEDESSPEPPTEGAGLFF